MRRARTARPGQANKNTSCSERRWAAARLQTQMLHDILLPVLSPSQFSHGGVRGRHIKTNVEPHLDSTFVFTTDISNFYPSISHRRVYRLFCETFRCSPDVARICTKLCTHDHHLALGLITSPILADQMMDRVDARVGGACRKAGLSYTRYVDDLTLSGPYDLAKSGIPDLVRRILEEHGFLVKADKTHPGRLADGMLITGLRVNRGHPDVGRDYLNELQRQLADTKNLAGGGQFDGPYFTQGQIRGRIEFVCWVNPGRRRTLLRSFRAIGWNKASDEAKKRGLVVTKKCLTRRSPVQ